MPIFEYRCEDCGKEFEELVFDRDECPPCPGCESENTGKLMSACCGRVMAAGGCGGGEPQYTSTASSGGGCSGCVGGNCATCK